MIAYFPALRGTFLWDDDGHVTKPALRSLHGLWRIWFDLGATQQYYPLLHSAFWVEHGVWGDAVTGYHLTNVLLHTTAALLVVALVRKLGFSQTAAWLAGFLFALHPVYVEAVAWISEQKSTLSTVFYLASALTYLHFDRTRKRWQYALALVLFVCALLSKSVTATLPAALLVVFWWQRGRLDAKRDVAPLAPWLVIGAAGGLFTAWVEKNYIGAQGAAFSLSFLDRILLAGRVICFYFYKLIFPANLTFFYPHWTIDAAQWWQYSFIGGVLAVAAGLVWFSKKNRGPLAAFLFFAGTLFPVLGFFNVYPFVYSYVADHFQYLASLGIVIPVAVLASKRLPVAAIVVALLAVLTWRQTRMYTDVETLYTETLARNPSSWISHNNLGNVLLLQPSRIPEAVRHFQTALQLNPGSAEPHNNLGDAYTRMPGHQAEAIAEFELALKYRPKFPQAENNLGTQLAKIPGRNAEAIEHLQKAIEIKPDYADAHNNLGSALSNIPGRMPEAVAQYELAIQLNPNLAEAHDNLAVALAQTPDGAGEALAQYETALRLDPNSAEAHSNIGAALTAQGRLPEAIDHLQTSLKLKPDSAEAHTNLGIALAKLPGRLPDAIAEYNTALGINPGYAKAHNNLGIVLAQSGRINEAIPHFEAAVQNEPDSVETRMNLGSAIEDIPGRLPQAIQQFEAAARLEPGLFEAHYLLGLALARAPGRSAEAFDQLQAAIKIKPDPEAQRILDEMRRLRK
ncbi:MAG TPA: tetratricopeptide repeat protein [Bryobacteraceae bacterium]|nr:tetratricopeptide repeat protein [Bryobacteraceae bacterium]